MLSKLVLETGYWYLASPYSKYHLGLERANDHICLVAADLLRRGIPIFSPIAHSHAIAMSAGIDPLAHDFWMAADSPLMGASHGIIVAMVCGWRDSKGVCEEVESFRAMGKPIVWLDPSVLGLEIPVDVPIE